MIKSIPTKPSKGFRLHKKRLLWIRKVGYSVSSKHEGSPLGSMVDFACDVDGSPILALNSFAFRIKACTSKDTSCFL
ncbi:hypothetical protein NC651_013670 [Populus alba x Populus x berolinensis]|nr:hypothetical protein NC651_013670 [Populus alba x Populus x berolinensis]